MQDEITPLHQTLAGDSGDPSSGGYFVWGKWGYHFPLSPQILARPPQGLQSPCLL